MYTLKLCMILTINKDTPEKEIDYDAYVERRHDIIFLTRKVRRDNIKNNYENEMSIPMYKNNVSYGNMKRRNLSLPKKIENRIT